MTRAAAEGSFEPKKVVPIAHVLPPHQLHAFSDENCPDAKMEGTTSLAMARHVD
eukprot:COSAG01_NODE_7865_length_3019_cov_6.573288_7_plen_54_part_00